MKKLLFGICSLIFTTSFAQSISGTIKDASTSEPLVGAHVRFQGYYQAVNTNGNGVFELGTFEQGEYVLIASYIGYENDTINVKLENGETQSVDFALNKKIIMTDEFVVLSTRVAKGAPMTFTNMNKEEIQKQNLGQDLPMLVNWTPSMVTSSDAGAGVGYTKMRIRGSDPTRINVTVNGIPINDPESQGTFWVNMPDFASSTDNLQIQRGLGTSSNGAASFGASVNLQTNTLKKKAYGEIANSFGSFYTRKHTVQFGSGIVDNKWAFDGRLSQIASDGYIDRASSDLRSYYLSGGYYGKKTVVKAITFSGQEKTYQSWYGTPSSRLENDETAMNEHADNNGYSAAQRENLLNSGRTYNFYLYDDETDNYQQDHYQLHISHQLSDQINFNAALHYTYGRGYFEQFKENEDFEDYGISPQVVGNDTIASTDLIRRRWLDNHFYGLTYSFNHRKGKFINTLGGAYNEYRGDHFGEIIWAQASNNVNIRDKFYDGDALKTDGNVYVKSTYAAGKKTALFVDVQFRRVNYETDGTDIDQRILDIEKEFNFINPKAGVSYQLNGKDQFYASFALGNREPVRNDFVDALEGREPKHESMQDYEAGYRRTVKSYYFNSNFFFMNYKNQLVLTGELNDVGSAIRANADKSYRAGIEFEFGWKINKSIKWLANATYSQHKIEEFDQIVYDYTNGSETVIENYKETDIAYSPSIISGSQLLVSPVNGVELGILSKYVGEQFLDNTSNANRKIDAYLVNDVRITYTIKGKLFKEMTFSFLVNNVLDEKYSSDGYTFSYIAGDKITENFFYPQAGRNYLAGLSLKF